MSADSSLEDTSVRAFRGWWESLRNRNVCGRLVLHSYLCKSALRFGLSVPLVYYCKREFPVLDHFILNKNNNGVDFTNQTLLQCSVAAMGDHSFVPLEIGAARAEMGKHPTGR
ncbi:hypothetical protein CY34DRAFT_152456 [Suillus luteus UH-Slu-Lm8-n1]|uniref:Uncharacterized protein n=1 Tax=Suillus luteus UH-Slu-Lm8-n1 TaxID=930992 RepID=A0A0D0AX19_9AGAM|nr:hypothetical protein CY34DRAFT_152456 [Suillus luteus UH-Slu-Lm8-n1]